MNLRLLFASIPRIVHKPKKIILIFLKKAAMYVSKKPKLRAKIILFINKYPRFKIKLKSLINNSAQHASHNMDIDSQKKDAFESKESQAPRSIGLNDDKKSPLEKWFY